MLIYTLGHATALPRRFQVALLAVEPEGTPPGGMGADRAVRYSKQWFLRTRKEFSGIRHCERSREWGGVDASASTMCGGHRGQRQHFSDWHFPALRGSSERLSRCCRGADQIRRGHLTLYTFGLRHFDQSYDSATGLPLEGIAGCIVDDSIFRRTKDHNDYIENWIRQGNTPPNSLLAYNRLIGAPFSEIPSGRFVALTPRKPIHFDDLNVSYSIDLGSGTDVDHNIRVKSSSFDWSHVVFIQDARDFGVALVADGQILAITCFADGKEGYAGKTYQSIQLFDRSTGISLNYAWREVGK